MANPLQADKRRRHSYFGCAVLLAIAGCSPPARSGTSSMVVTGGTVSGGTPGKEVKGSAGNIVLKPGVPATFFGVVQRPGGTFEFSYFLLLKPGSVSSCQSLNSNCTLDNEKLSSKYGLVIEDRKLEVDYELHIQSGKEKLTVGGQDYATESGRLFLVDMSVIPPQVTQVDSDLKAESPHDHWQQGSTAVVEAVSNQTAERLKQRLPAVADFLKTAQ